LLFLVQVCLMSCLCLVAVVQTLLAVVVSVAVQVLCRS
jgi:hypothetical protein